MKKISDDIKKKIALTALAVVSFSAVLVSIYFQKNDDFREVAMKEVTSEASKDLVIKKNEKMLNKFSGTRYVCDDEKFVFVDIHKKNDSDEREAEIAVVDLNERYAMAYFKEQVGIGKDRKFVDENKAENYLIITDNGNEVKFIFNNLPVVNNCIKK